MKTITQRTKNRIAENAYNQAVLAQLADVPMSAAELDAVALEISAIAAKTVRKNASASAVCAALRRAVDESETYARYYQAKQEAAQ